MGRPIGAKSIPIRASEKERVTLTIPTDLKKELKIASEIEGRPASEINVEALRWYFKLGKTLKKIEQKLGA